MFTTYHVAQLYKPLQTFIGTRILLAWYGQGWSEHTKGLFKMPGVHQWQHIFICLGSEELETTIPWLSSTSFIATKPFWCHKKRKEVIEILCRRWLVIQKRLQSSTSQVHNRRWDSQTQDVHAGECGEHQRGPRLSKQIMHLWLNMEADSLTFTQRWQACQLYRNRIHAPTAKLHSMATPSPFYTWAFNLIDPINPPSWGNIWILTLRKHYIK